MTKAEFDRAKEVCEKATPGEWTVVYNGNSLLSVAAPAKGKCIALPKKIEKGQGDYRWEVNPTAEDKDCDDFNFIAESRTLLPKAIVKIEKLEAALRKIANRGFHGCGCRPKCKCLEPEALEIFREKVSGFAQEALKDAP